MSRLPGRVDWWPPDLERWLRRLAEVLPRIHAAPIPPPGTLRRFVPYPQASYRPPGWARYPSVWERAAEISCGPPPGLPDVLVHRDFHPGNVLCWQRSADGTYQPWADVVTIIGFLDDLRGDWGSERLLIEDILARAVAELGGPAI